MVHQTHGSGSPRLMTEQHQSSRLVRNGETCSHYQAQPRSSLSHESHRKTDTKGLRMLPRTEGELSTGLALMPLREEKLRCKKRLLLKPDQIKCDGSRPHCTQCRESGRHCVFGEDGRPNARVSKEAIQAINNKMADLEYALLQRGLAGNHQALDESSSSQYAAFDVRRSLAPDCAVSADRITPDVHMQNDHHILSDTASASRHQEHYSVDCPSKGSTVNASSLEINALVHSESGLSLHGPTSSLRPPLSLLSSRSSPNRVKSVSPSALEKERNLKDWKLQLFAQTSLERQKEYYHIIHGNTDLDGVDPTLAFNLLGFYWNHQHNTYLVTYRPAIMHSLATGGPYCNKLLLNSLFYTGALQSGHESLMNEEKDPATLGSRFFERFQQLVSSQVEISSIPTIAALIVMGSAVLTRGKQTLGWMYSGMAFRMIADLGLHLDPDKVNHSQFISKETTYNLTATDIEQQRRVFWGAFMQDRFQSLFYGRRPEISLFHGFEPPTELLDTFDELETWSPHRDTSASNEYNPTPTYVPQQKHNISNRDSLLKLAHLTSEIIELFYIPSTTKLAFDQALHAIDSIQTKLDLWFQQLPTHLQYEPGKDPAPPPHRFYPQ